MRRGSSSNYAYGMKMERRVGKLFSKVLGGISEYSKGSRGPADIHHKLGNLKLSIQVKSSRSNSKGLNKIRKIDKEKLRSYSKMNNTLPVIVEMKGGHIKKCEII